MKLILLLFFFVVIGLFALRAIAVLRARSTGTEIDPGDPAFADAERRARDTLPDFLKRLAAPQPGESDFMVKYRLRSGAAPEQIWVEHLERREGSLTGRLANDPITPGYRINQVVEIDEAAILDWGFMDKGVMQGHFSTRVFMGRMPPAASEETRRQFGW